jgi:D-alanyl-D-alanine carboxypeptidase
LARAGLARLLLALAVIGATVLAMAPPAQAMQNLRKYAAIVVDAKTGKTLYESQADSARYPASITKVMTLYILFQELEAGHVSLKSLFTVSRHAAAAVPTKLGLHPGSKIKVEDVIKSIVTLSANDMARVVAENISGSEAAFAKRMTATARALGMDHTTYVNASGLPDGRQRTTVRDQAILARAVYEHFPKYYHFFNTRRFAYGRRVYGNHDHLLGYMGIDGMKTGYINAAGYNLMTVTRKGDKHLVVIAFGFNSWQSRDKKVRELVAAYLPKARSGDYLEAALVPVPNVKGRPAPHQKSDMIEVAALPKPPKPAPLPDDLQDDGAPEAVALADAVVPMPLPSFRQPITPVAAYADPIVPQPARSNQVATLPRPAESQPQRPAIDAANSLGAPTAARKSGQHVDIIGNWITNTFQLGAPPAPLGQTRPSAPLVPPVGIGEDGQSIDFMTSGSISNKLAAADPQPTPAVAEPARVTPGGWVVQIGAAPSEDGANRLLTTAANKLDSLGNYHPYVERFDKNGRVFYRARFAGMDDRAAATSLCNELKKAKMSCLALQS